MTATGPVSSGSAYETGTAVELRYDPDHPLDVELQSGRGRGSAAMTRLFAGIAILLAASALAVIAVSGSAPRGCPAHRTAIHRITC